MKKVISWEVAEALLSMAAYIVTLQSYTKTGVEPDAESVNVAASDWFSSFCDCEGIEGVEEPR